VEDPPAQIADGLFVTVRTGRELTVTVEVADPVHVPALPVTVYIVVVAGLTLMVFVVAPVLQVKVVAPAAVSSVLAPMQIVGELTVIPTFAPTVTVAVCVPVHEPLIPVTVYIVVVTGATEIVLVV